MTTRKKKYAAYQSFSWSTTKLEYYCNTVLDIRQ